MTSRKQSPEKSREGRNKLFHVHNIFWLITLASVIVSKKSSRQMTGPHKLVVLVK